MITTGEVVFVTSLIELVLGWYLYGFRTTARGYYGPVSGRATILLFLYATFWPITKPYLELTPVDWRTY